MKILFCAYDRPGHIATGPNAWIQRLVFDLHLRYHLDITTLFFYTGKISECPTISYFESNNLTFDSYCISKHQYIEDQVKYLLKTVQKNNISVVVANLTVPGYYSAKYLNEYNIPSIPVFHSNDDFTKGVFKKFIENTSNNNFSASVAVSSYINSLSKNNGYVIPCGTPQGKDIAKPPSCQLKIIYAGRLAIEAKQIIKLTNAFIAASKQNSDLHFSIVGDGPYHNEVKLLVDENGSDNITLYPAVPQSKIINKIAKHHVITLLSDYEGMPIAVMEAMSVGVVPVCYVGEGGISELIEHGVNGYIVTDREQDYQEKLNLLQKDSDLWQRMSKNAIKTIEDKYSTEITHKKWAKLLNSFRNTETQKISIPKKIILEGQPLLYGDIRKPECYIRLKLKLEKTWMNLRLAIRPRARLKALLKNRI